MPILEDIFEGKVTFNEIGITKDKDENELIRLVKNYVDGIRKKDKEYVKQFPFIPCDILHEFVLPNK